MVKEVSISQIMENGMTKRVYIWSLPTRLFHGFLIIGVLFSYIFSEFENLLNYHVIFGYFVGVLFLYRIIWGFMDVKYSKFKDFSLNIKSQFEYLKNVFGEKKEYPGHNPASSMAIILMIILGILSVISGMVVYGAQEGMGLFASLNSTIFKKMEFFEELHELFTNAFLGVVFIHIAGVVLDRVVHGSKAVESMISGYKDVNLEPLKLTAFQKAFGFLWIGSALLFLVYLFYYPQNPFVADKNKAVDYRVEHRVFYDECSSCHMLYPPYLLPTNSWVKMMDDLENHFGDDASLEEEDKESIKEFLVKNSAQNSTKEAAFKIYKSVKKDDIIAITKTPYWKKRHERLDKNLFKDKKVGKISNCKACHKNIEKGLLNDKDISIPKKG